MRRANVDLRIDELVLHGFNPADRHRIGDAVRMELARLLAERGLVQPPPLDRPVVAAGKVMLPRHAPARTVGARVARAVVGVLRR